MNGAGWGNQVAHAQPVPQMVRAITQSVLTQGGQNQAHCGAGQGGSHWSGIFCHPWKAVFSILREGTIGCIFHGKRGCFRYSYPLHSA